MDKGRLGVVQPSQSFERNEARLGDHDKPLDPVRRLGELAGAALPPNPIADIQVATIDGDL